MALAFLVLNEGPQIWLCVATPAEWDQILKANQAAQNERRYFICDCFEDCSDLIVCLETSRRRIYVALSEHGI